MCKWFALILISVAFSSVTAQTPSKYQPGTVTAVTPHQNAPGEPSADVARYDVSVKVGDTVYVVLYTPTPGGNSKEYSTGLEFLVSIGSNTLTVSNKLGGTTELPILRREPQPARPTLDWSKAPGQYFSMKQKHLSETLSLSDEQLAKIQPALEQETGEVGELFGNPVLSRKEKLNRWEKIVQSSDEKIKPVLSETQFAKLQQLRKEQKQELKRLIAEPKAGNPN
jgi:hypothetical protein